MSLRSSSQSARHIRAIVGGLTLGALASLAACSSPGTSTRTDSSQPPALARSDSSPSAASASEPNGLARLDLAFDKPAVVGASVRATASGLPPGKSATLSWGTVTGGWVIEDYYHFRGKKFSESTKTLGQFSVDAAGRLDAAFTIPEDYGGVHEVTLLVDGKPVAQNGIDVTQTFALSPTTGPVGTPLELKITGLGWRTMESTWVVNWDNQQVGFVSAVGTRGSAVGRFRAAGPVGDHIVKMYTGWQAQAYLNYEQSPVADLPRPQFTFHTTSGPSGPTSVSSGATPASSGATTALHGGAAYAEPYKPQPIPKADVNVAGATLALTPSQGPVGTRAKLEGAGFTPGDRLTLAWQTSVGSRVSGNGFVAEERKLTDIQVGNDGRVAMDVTIPEDLGGLHGVALRKGQDLVARTHFAIETSIVEMTPRSGPAGTPVSIHLKGVGWTEYDNIYVATYDNAYMGYACGFNSQGDVVINFTAAGAPGPHLIDLYPGIYQGPATEPQQLYRQPQLTYADDHPGNIIPALRFTFEVTPGSPRSPGRSRNE